MLRARYSNLVKANGSWVRTLWSIPGKNTSPAVNSLFPRTKLALKPNTVERRRDSSSLRSRPTSTLPPASTSPASGVTASAAVTSAVRTLSSGGAMGSTGAGSSTGISATGVSLDSSGCFSTCSSFTPRAPRSSSYPTTPRRTQMITVTTSVVFEISTADFLPHTLRGDSQGHFYYILWTYPSIYSSSEFLYANSVPYYAPRRNYDKDWLF